MLANKISNPIVFWIFLFTKIACSRTKVHVKYACKREYSVLCDACTCMSGYSDSCVCTDTFHAITCVFSEVTFDWDAQEAASTLTIKPLFVDQTLDFFLLK